MRETLEWGKVINHRRDIFILDYKVSHRAWHAIRELTWLELQSITCHRSEVRVLTSIRGEIADLSAQCMMGSAVLLFHINHIFSIAMTDKFEMSPSNPNVVCHSVKMISERNF